MLKTDKWFNVSRLATEASDVDEGLFENHRNAGEPLVMRGESANAPAVTKWTPDYLKQHCGSQTVSVVVSSDGDYKFQDLGYTDESARRIVEMSLAEFLDRLNNEGNFEPVLGDGEVYYLYSSPQELYEVILDDLPPPRFMNDVPQETVRSYIWVSGEGNITFPHCDPCHDNILVQVRGRKRLFLWDPSQAPLLYVGGFNDAMPGMSPVLPKHPQPEKYPDFQRATAIEAVLEEGDALFLPDGWGHYVIAESFSVSANYWYPRHQTMQKAIETFSLELKKLPPQLQVYYLHLYGFSSNVISKVEIDGGSDDSC